MPSVYDRAALVALPEKMRNQYAVHLTQITERASQLLICYEYDQSLMEGPPFSISSQEMHKHYSDSYTLDRIASIQISGGLKGLDGVKENVWLLRNN